MAPITIRNIKKSFPASGKNKSQVIEVIGGVDLDIADGEFVSFFGPNGCGKSTFFSLMGGLLEPDAGFVDIGSTSHKRARLGFIFQNYRESLYPWLRNIDNIAFPLQLQGVVKHERRKQAEELFKNFGLEVPLSSFPYQLSGGQQQMLAIARALIFDADVLLMDEPFAALDYTTRFFLRDRVQDIWLKTGTTTIMISHDITDALYMSDRLILFSQKPMHVIEDIRIPFKRPRESSLLEQNEFFDLQAHALHIFKEEIAR